MESDHPICSVMLCSPPPFELQTKDRQYGSGFTASFADPRRSTWRDDTFNHQQQATSGDCLKAQGLRFCQDEVRRPHRPLRAPQSPSSPYQDDHKSFASLQSKTLPPLKKIIPASAPENIIQQVQPGLNATLLPAPSSGISDQRGSCAVDILPLLNPTDQKDTSKSSRVPKSLSAATVAVPGLTKPEIPTLTSAICSPPHHMGLEAPDNEEQNFRRHDIDATLPQPASSDDTTSSYHLSHKLTNRTKQPQSSLSNSIPSSAHASAFLRTSFDSSSTAQSQYQIMMLDTAQGAIQVPVDVQAASKVADEKRKRNATASHNFRQRRKEKERETRESTDRLKAQIRKIAEERDDYREERDHYRNERDYFQNVAFYNHIPIESRPLSPRRRRHGWHDGTLLGASSG